MRAILRTALSGMVQLVNLLGADGDFEIDTNSDGITDGWANGDATSVTAKSINAFGYTGSKSQRFTGNNSGIGLVHAISMTAGHIYYICGYQKSNASCQIRIYSNTTNKQASNVITGDTWALASLLRTADGTETHIKICPYGAAGTVDTDSIFAFDLTQIFARKEFSKTKMDALMSKMITQGYFVRKGGVAI